MMDTKTCPHCNEVAIKYFTIDTGDLCGVLIAWKCGTCSRRFYTEEEEKNEM